MRFLPIQAFSFEEVYAILSINCGILSQNQKIPGTACERRRNIKNQLDYFIGIEPENGGNCPSEPLYDIGNEMEFCWTEETGLRVFFRVFLLKAEFDPPTAEVLIESLRTDAIWRLPYGREHSSRVPSEAIFSRAFADFAKVGLPGME